MNIRRFLARAGLGETEISLLLYVKENPGISVFSACKKLDHSKSNIYRACDSLLKKGLLIEGSEKWKKRLYFGNVKYLIRSLESTNRSNKTALSFLRAFDSSCAWNGEIGDYDIELTNTDARSPIRHILKNTLGFGGVNASLVFSQGGH